MHVFVKARSSFGINENVDVIWATLVMLSFVRLSYANLNDSPSSKLSLK